jgi:hypothetical protein
MVICVAFLVMVAGAQGQHKIIYLRKQVNGCN